MVVQPPASKLSWLNLLFFWALATAAGGAAAYGFILMATQVMINRVFPGTISALIYAGGPLGGAVGGLVAGAGQWLALRSRVRQSQVWIMATVIGWSAGFTLTFLIFFRLLEDGLSYLALLGPWVVGGAIAGIAEYLILRRWFPEGTHWWVVASAAGWTVGWILAITLGGIALTRFALPPGAGVAVLGGIHGAVIGVESGLALLALSILARIERDAQARRDSGIIGP